MGIRRCAVEGVVVNHDFWQDRRVLLTGHTGFKGAWLALWLDQLGAEVTGLALDPPSSPSLFDAADVEDALSRHVIGDIRNFETVTRVMNAHQPDIVLHLAAQSLVVPSYDHPIDTYMTNVMGTAHVLEAARQCPSVRVVLNVTTDKCYENQEWHWGYREGDPMGGHDPYSSSKGCSELLTASYSRSYFSDTSSVRLASARAGNVIGGGDWADHRIIPDFMRAVLAGEPLVVRNPDAIRPWQHVLEPLSGYLTLAERLFRGRDVVGAWNFGPFDNDARTVGWIADRLTERWPGASWQTTGDGERPHEATYLKLDCSKARAELGWSPRLDLSGALDWIVEWYSCFASGGDIAALTRAQIERYEALP